MKTKYLILVTLMYLLSHALFSQNYLFKEDFNNNINHWRMINESIKSAKIESGIYTQWNGGISWDGNVTPVSFDPALPHTISISIANLHNEKNITYAKYMIDKNGNPKPYKEYIEAPFWGIVWGYKDWDNYHSIVFNSKYNVYGNKELHYTIQSTVAGNIINHSDGFKKVYGSYLIDNATGFNTIQIVKDDNKYSIYIGDNLTNYLGYCNLTEWYDKGVGMLVGPAAKVALDYLYITSPENINLNKATVKNTQWTFNNLKTHFITNPPDKIEGIWEDFDLNIDVSKMNYGGNYKLGIVKSNEGYDIVYLSGDSQNNSVWQDGMLKGRIVKTGSEGIMKAEWFGSDMTSYSNVYVYLDENKLLNLAFKDKNSSTKMLKLYPTSNSNESNSSETKSDYTSSGSGIILNNNGFIATNYHVIADAQSILIQLTQSGKIKTYNAKVVISDKTNDLSILEITDNNFKGFGVVPYGIKNNICDVGTSVFAMGYPMSSVLGEEIKVTDGLISSKTGYQGDIVTYQISVPIQPGNSGGPLFDKQGNLVGITNAGIPSAENVGYAIKTSYLKNLIDVAPSKISLPAISTIANLLFTEKIKILSNYVVFIKVK